MNIQRILRKILSAESSAILWKNRKSKSPSNEETCYTTSTWFYLSLKLDDQSRLKPSLIRAQPPVASISTPFPKRQLNRIPFWFNFEALIPPNQWIKS
uniref:Uncharacterized protein n=1 Tax=Cacao swollen shoot virus TaxID=31559 RepID=A0A6M3R5H9_9VIRU|nr:hypothetical protein [Cacao swollen shoot virus]